MPRNFLQRCFNEWLKINEHRFKYPPCNIRYKWGGIQFNLSGIIPELKWSLHARNSGLYVHFRNHPCWDIISSCEVEEKKTVNGLYYCGYCADGDGEIKSGRKVMLFSTRKALWHKECFEMLITNTDYCTQANHWLCISGDEEGWSTSARIWQQQEAEKIISAPRKDFILALPIHIK